MPIIATLKERVSAVKTERDIAQAAFDRTVAEMRLEARLTEGKIAAFVEVMRANVLSGDISLRRAWRGGSGWSAQFCSRTMWWP